MGLLKNKSPHLHGDIYTYISTKNSCIGDESQTKQSCDTTAKQTSKNSKNKKKKNFPNLRNSYFYQSLANAANIVNKFEQKAKLYFCSELRKTRQRKKLMNSTKEKQAERKWNFEMKIKL
jgi:hypothetical protein